MAVKGDTGLKRRGRSVSDDERRREKPENKAGLSVVQGQRKRRGLTVFRVFARLAVVSLVIVAGVFIYSRWDKIQPENILLWLNDKLAGGESGDGFPFEITGSSVIGMESTRGGLALLTNNSLVLLNSKGGEVYRRLHGFSKPIMRAGGRWILVADSGGSRLRLESRLSTAVEMTVKNKITSVDVSDRGCFAVATDSTGGYASEVAVYRQNSKEPFFHWLDSSFVILDVAISPDEKSMAVVGVTAQGGGMKSCLKIFDFDKESPAAQYEQNDVMLFAVGYFPNGTIAAVGNSAVWVYNKSGTIRQQHGFDGRRQVGYVIGESAVSVALSRYGGIEGGTVLTVNSSGDKAYETDYEGGFRSMAAHGSDVLVLTSEYLCLIDITGQKYAGETIKDGRIISAFGKKAMVLGLNSLIETDFPSKN